MGSDIFSIELIVLLNCSLIISIAVGSWIFASVKAHPLPKEMYEARKKKILQYSGRKYKLSFDDDRLDLFWTLITVLYLFSTVICGLTIITIWIYQWAFPKWASVFFLYVISVTIRVFGSYLRLDRSVRKYGK